MQSISTIKLFSPGSGAGPGNWTVSQVVDFYLSQKEKEVQVGAFSAKSLERSRYYLKSFCEMFGKLPISHGEKRNILDWVIENPQWEATFTRQDAVGCVVSCFRAVEEELGFRSPYRRPRFLGPPIMPRPAIQPGEYLSIRAHARRHRVKGGRLSRTRLPFRAMLLFLWKTGCRTCEAREAEFDQIDWVRAVIVQNKGKVVQATGEARIIPVRCCLPLLRWLQRRRRKGQRCIFVNSIGGPWSCDRFAKEFRRYARLAGVREEVSAYCLRHGLCVRLLEEGKGERQIADVLGHKGTRYVSWYGRGTKAKTDYLNKILDGRDG